MVSLIFKTHRFTQTTSLMEIDECEVYILNYNNMARIDYLI